MESHSLARLFSGIGEIARLLFRRNRRRLAPQSSMIGLAPSARGLTGRPAEITQHAIQVAREWEDVVETYVQERMRLPGIRDQEIGAPDYERGIDKRAFLPDGIIGGSNGTGRRLFVDSGVLNPLLNAEVIGPAASTIVAKSRLRDRIDAVLAHEHLEARGIP